MAYELYYWPGLQGRGEYIRLALEYAKAPYTDVAREDGGMDKMMSLMESADHLPFAPPFLKSGKMMIAQTANILLYLGERHNLAPKSESGKLWVHQLQLTIADFVQEVHGTHHPVAVGLYYEDQKKEAAIYSEHFRKERIPKFLGYFHDVLAGKKGAFLMGDNITYADLSLFQIIDGLLYAFPKTTKRQLKKLTRLKTLHTKIAAHPRLKAYLASERRLPFNEEGIFRHYPALDGG